MEYFTHSSRNKKREISLTNKETNFAYFRSSYFFLFDSRRPFLRSGVQKKRENDGCKRRNKTVTSMKNELRNGYAAHLFFSVRQLTNIFLCVEIEKLIIERVKNMFDKFEEKPRRNPKFS